MLRIPFILFEIFFGFFVKLSVDVVRINLFDNFSNLIHASSPRYFKNTSDEIEQYDFVGRDSSEKKRST